MDRCVRRLERWVQIKRRCDYAATSRAEGSAWSAAGSRMESEGKNIHVVRWDHIFQDFARPENILLAASLLSIREEQAAAWIIARKVGAGR